MCCSRIMARSLIHKNLSILPSSGNLTTIPLHQVIFSQTGKPRMQSRWLSSYSKSARSRASRNMWHYWIGVTHPPKELELAQLNVSSADDVEPNYPFVKHCCVQGILLIKILLLLRKWNKHYYNRQTKLRSLILPGERVRMRLPGEKTWSSGTCTGLVAPRSYDVQVEERHYWRNRCHIFRTRETRAIVNRPALKPSAIHVVHHRSCTGSFPTASSCPCCCYNWRDT